MRTTRCLVLGLVLAGCTSERTPPDDAANTAPTVTLDALAVGQGQTIAVDLMAADAEGDEIVAIEALSPHAGLEAAVVDGSLTLHASPDLAGPIALTLRATDARDAAGEQIHSVDIPPIGWRNATSWQSAGPEAREHGAMLIDAEGRYALLIGGSGYDPYLEPLGDVWRFDLDANTWSAVTPSGDVPPPGGSRRVAQLPGTTTAYLFGGYGEGSGVFGELYRVDHQGGEAVFTLVEQVNPPPARALHAFVYDPVTERFFAFGGFGQGVYGDTWSMQLDGGVAHWTEHVLAAAPSRRYGFFYGFDADSGRLILFSGAQGTAAVNPAHDTWALDVRSDPPSWQLLLDEAASPPGRRNGCMIFDPSGPRLWVFGGTPDAMTTAPGLWSFDARPGHEAWAQVVRDGEPPLRSSGFGAYDPLTEQVWLGFGNSSSGVYRDLHALGYE